MNEDIYFYLLVLFFIFLILVVFITTYIGHQFDHSKEQCTLKTRIKEKFLVRFELTFPPTLEKLGYIYKLLYQLGYKSIDGIQITVKRSINMYRLPYQLGYKNMDGIQITAIKSINIPVFN